MHLFSLHRLLWICFLCCLLHFPLEPGFAAPVSGPQTSPETPWEVEADSVSADQDIQLLEAWGDVTLHKGENYLKADYVRYYWSTRWVYLRGNVQGNWGGDHLQAEEAEFDLQSKVGWLNNGTIFVQDPHMYFQGRVLRKTGTNTYAFEDATVTACDGQVPAWSLRSASGEITVNGYARLWHPRLQIKNRPLLYAPYLTIPVKTKRQSGFLWPDLTVSSEHGAGFNLPYYWAINEEQDATFYLNPMDKTGVRAGVEYRHTPNLSSQGMWLADWLYDRSTATAASDTEYENDGLLRPNHNRYWLRGKYDGKTFGNLFDLKVDVDYLSDQDYLNEFDQGPLGFERSRQEFLDVFGRTIEDEDDITRENRLYLSRNWQDSGLRMRLEYTQNLAFANDNRDSSLDDTLQRLPQLEYDIYRTALGTTPLEWSAENELTYFWREYGTTGSRLDLRPRLSLPLESAYGSLIPTLGLRQTVYGVERFESTTAAQETDSAWMSRTLWDFEATANTEFGRVFNLAPPPAVSNATAGAASRWTKLKHVVRPELSYEYQPYVDQSDYPDFDDLDRIEPRDELTYSLTQVFTGRRDNRVPVAAANGTTQRFKRVPRYTELARIRLEQSYDFREATRQDDREQYPRRPFSDILVDIETGIAPWLRLDNKTWFSPYLGTITEHEHLLRGTWPEVGSCFFGLDYHKQVKDDYARRDNDALRTLTAGATLTVIPKWSARVRYEKDLLRSELVERQFAVQYRHQCWQAEAVLTQTDEEDRVEVRVTLNELGTVGQSFQASEEQ